MSWLGGEVHNGVRSGRESALQGVQRTFPLALGDLSVGMVFGVAARHAGLSPAEAILMSGLVNAGTSQFVALGMWGAPMPAVAIIATTMLVNLRHLLMGAALHPRLSRVSTSKLFLSAFFLTDETFALTLREFPLAHRDAAFILGSGALLVVTWLTGTWIGATAGDFIHDPAHWGLDFVSTAALAAVLVGIWKDRSSLLPWLAAGAAAVVTSRLLPGNIYILVGGAAGSLVGVFAGNSGRAVEGSSAEAIRDAE